MKQKLHLLVTAAALGFAGSSQAETISSFDFTSGSASSSDTEPLTATSVISAAGSGLTAVTFANNQLEINGEQTDGDGASRALDVTDNVYFSFNISVPTDVTLSLDQITFDFGYNNSFGYNAELRGSHDNFNSTLWSEGSSTTGDITVAAQTEIDPLSDISGFQNVSNDTLEFRFYLADQSGSATRWFIFDDIAVTGTAAPVPEPSSFALLAGCFGLAWVMMRRR